MKLKNSFFGIAFLCVFSLFFLTTYLSAQECTEGKYPQQSDTFFPPSSAAAATINFDGRGFIISGKRVFITSGSIHYPRVPRENWRDILLKLKRSGFNTVETYVFWNYHETNEGVYDFSSENRDFGAFLDMAKELGLYAIVRVGPYICGEWENGGYPNWLYSKTGLEVRKDNAIYLNYVEKWFNKVLPIISRRQIQKHGNVIMVQLENEMPSQGWKFWGTNSDGKHMDKLMELAHKNGLEVPLIYSGSHHAFNPAPDVPINISARKSPWLCMELWTTWFSDYGCSGTNLIKAERAPWRVLSQGGAGFNLYMFHGGTSFGYNNFNNDRKFGDDAEKGMACYDYGTLVGQTGDTRELYLRLKRLAYQAETYSSILAQSIMDTVNYTDFAKGIHCTVRTSPVGSIVFLDNKNSDTTVVLNNGLSVKLAAKEIAAFPMNVELAKGVKISESGSRILSIVKQKDITTVVCFGEKGDKATLKFSAVEPISEMYKNSEGFTLHKGENPVLFFEFSDKSVGEKYLNFGKNRIRILTMSKETADKTWIVDTNFERQIVVGAPYLGEFSEKSANKISAEVDYLPSDEKSHELVVYNNAGVVKLHSPIIKPMVQTSIQLQSWKMGVYTIPSISKDSTWSSLPDGATPELSMNGNNSPYAWYHSSIKNDSSVTSLLFKRIGDRATFFVDGKMVGLYNIKTDKIAHIPVNIPAGNHELSVFVAHAGRNKFSGYVGAINKLEYQKGLRGPVLAEMNSGFMPVGNWKMKGDVDPTNPEMKWEKVSKTKNNPTFFKTQFELNEISEVGTVYRLTTDDLSYGNIWFNGHNVGRYPEIVKGCPGIWLPSCWMKKGENTIVIFDEQGMLPYKVKIIQEALSSRQRVLFTN